VNYAGKTRRLKAAKINLQGLWGYTNSAGKGKIACVPRDTKKFIQRTKNLGLATSRRVAFHISGPDRVGALCHALDLLDKARININVLDAIGFSGRFGAYIWVDPKDVKTASKALKS
jgi:hypothetical protein